MEHFDGAEINGFSEMLSRNGGWQRLRESCPSNGVHHLGVTLELKTSKSDRGSTSKVNSQKKSACLWLMLLKMRKMLTFCICKQGASVNLQGTSNQVHASHWRPNCKGESWKTGSEHESNPQCVSESSTMARWCISWGWVAEERKLPAVSYLCLHCHWFSCWAGKMAPTGKPCNLSNCSCYSAVHLHYKNKCSSTPKTPKVYGCMHHTISMCDKSKTAENRLFMDWEVSYNQLACLSGPRRKRPASQESNSQSLSKSSKVVNHTVPPPQSLGKDM